MRKVDFAVITALALVGACSSNNNGDDDDTGTTPTASGVFPAQGFSGRDLRVEITGDATSWSSTTTVSFGAGVTVNSIAAASTTDLFADISIDPTAAAGLQDVTVTDGSSTFKLSQAFEIDAPATTVFSGSVAQGSIAEFTITSVDIANPFDTTTGQDADGNTIYPNIAFAALDGVGIEIDTVTNYSISGLLLTDVDAAPASGAFGVASGPAGGTVVMTNVGTITVAARTATVLTAGTAAQGNVATAFDSQLYSFTPGTAPDVQALTLSATNPNAGPQVAVLPSSGHFADLISFGPTDDALNATTGAQQYLVYWDNTGTTGNYTIEEDDTALTHTTALTTAEDVDTAPAALTAPAYASNGDLGTATGEVWMKFTVAAGDVGKVVHIVTNGSATPDIAVFASKADADTADTDAPAYFASAAGNSLVSPAITTAGTYYVQVFADFFGGGGNDFGAGLYLAAH